MYKKVAHEHNKIQTRLQRKVIKNNSEKKAGGSKERSLTKKTRRGVATRSTFA